MCLTDIQSRERSVIDRDDVYVEDIYQNFSRVKDKTTTLQYVGW